MGAIAQPRPSFEDHVYRYVQAVVAGDSLAARWFWSREDLAHAERLGIRHPGAVPKIDGASVIAAELARLRRQELELSVGGQRAEGDRAWLVARIRGGDETLETEYVGDFDGERWWLRHPLRLAVEGWPVEEREYLRFLIHPDLGAHELAFAAMDAFVAACADSLGFDPAPVAAAKLDVVLAPPAVLEDFVGIATEGLANLQLDTVLTQHPYHPHELVHVLVNVALGEQAPFTLPLLQEGLAVWLGGRYDAAPEMQRQFGAVALANGLVELDDVLSFRGFREEPADLSYPVAALVVDALHGRVGGAGLLGLTRELSGSLERIDAMSAVEVRTRLAAGAGMRWPQLSRAIRQRARQLRSEGIQPNPVDRHDPDLTLRDGDLTVSLRAAGPRLRVVVAAEGEFPEVGILWPGDERFTPSPLFAEHHPGRPHDGERYGLFVRPGEVGLYDYALGILLAKRVHGFDPAPGFWFPKQSTMRFSVARSRLPVGGRDPVLRRVGAGAAQR